MIQKLKQTLVSDHNLKELLTGSSITFVLKVLGMILSYLVVILISTRYGAEGVGLYSLSLKTLTSISIFCALGFNVSVLRYVGQFNLNSQANNYLRKIFKYFIQLTFPVTIIMGLLIFILSEHIALNVFGNENYIMALKLIAFGLPFFTLNLINVEFIRGLKLLKVSEFLRSANIYLVIGVVMLISFLNYNELNSVYALVVATVITFCFSLGFIIFKLSSINSLITGAEGFTRKDFLKTSIPMMVTTVSSLILAFSGLFFLEAYASTATVGVYNVCVMLSQMVSLPLTVVNTISAPKFSELYWNDKYESLKRVLRQSSKLIFWISIVVALILIMFSGFILRIFGDEFVLGKEILWILVLGQIINAITGSVGVFLNMTGHQKVLKNIILFTMILVVLSYYFLIPIYGTLGAALVSVFGIAVLNIASAFYVYKKLNYVTFYIPFLKV